MDAGKANSAARFSSSSSSREAGDKGTQTTLFPHNNQGKQGSDVLVASSRSFFNNQSTPKTSFTSASRRVVNDDGRSEQTEMTNHPRHIRQQPVSTKMMFADSNKYTSDSLLPRRTQAATAAPTSSTRLINDPTVGDNTESTESCSEAAVKKVIDHYLLFAMVFTNTARNSTRAYQASENHGADWKHNVVYPGASTLLAALTLAVIDLAKHCDHVDLKNIPSSFKNVLITNKGVRNRVIMMLGLACGTQLGGLLSTAFTHSFGKEMDNHGYPYQASAGVAGAGDGFVQYAVMFVTNRVINALSEEGPSFSSRLAAQFKAHSCKARLDAVIQYSVGAVLDMLADGGNEMAYVATLKWSEDHTSGIDDMTKYVLAGLIVGLSAVVSNTIAYLFLRTAEEKVEECFGDEENSSTEGSTQGSDTDSSGGGASGRLPTKSVHANDGGPAQQAASLLGEHASTQQPIKVVIDGAPEGAQ